jgi:hypothetical protein
MVLERRQPSLNCKFLAVHLASHISKNLAYSYLLLRHLTANELTGKIPADFFELTKLESLYSESRLFILSVSPRSNNLLYVMPSPLLVAYNSFSGTLSTEFGKMTKLVDF